MRPRFSPRTPFLPLLLTASALLLPGAATVGTAAPEPPKVVPVGAGSYAEFPPPGAGGGRDKDPVAEMQTRPLFIDESQNNKPVPTNQWWTDLIVHPFGGRLWAHPLVVQARPEGCDIYYPTQWGNEGRDMTLDHPLELRGEVVPLPASANPTPDLVIADFEGDHFPPGWTTTGTAFGPGPAKGAWPGQTAVSGYGGKGLANSAFPNDAAKGTLSSPKIVLQRHYVHFLVGGGKRPDALRVLLLAEDGHTVLRSVTGENSEHLKWQTWDVADLRGKPVILELEDNADGGWAHILADNFIQSESPTPPANVSADPNAFNAADAKALRWGDWTLTFRLRQSASQRMDVTVGHGLPFTWVECLGVTPVLNVDADAACANERGEALAAGGQSVGDSLAVQLGGRWFGVYAPDRSTFQRVGGQVRVRFPAGTTAGFVVVAALPGREALAKFHDLAFAVPRDSRLNWAYDPARGEVKTTWKLDTAPLKGAYHATLQAWAPHHYREASNHLAFDGTEYASARGLLKCAPGTEWELTYPFAGLLPNLPMPSAKDETAANPFDPARMHTYLSEYATNTKYGDDTYWGGKDILCYGRYLAMAAEANDDADAATLRTTLRGALADWFTYTPGESAHFFARYPRWKALVGFKTSYGSEGFNDQHFHYGYFTTAAALLGMQDPAFLKDYGPMARLVAKEYANWEREDGSFPFLRTFDAWEGHSWAGGVGSANGNNQESSSEAVQSWGGVFLLGSVLGDDAMTAAGAMGYAMEVAATREYWFDYHGHKDGPAAATFAPTYPHAITGILGGGGRGHGTYFSGDPAWVYGIQTLPASPFLNYLGWDPAFGRWQFDAMWAERQKSNDRDKTAPAGPAYQPTAATISAMNNLGTVILGAALQFDPDWAAARMDELWASHDPVMVKDDMRGIVYYLAHAGRTLGPEQVNCHTSVPTSTVFHNARTNQWRAVIYNPRPAAQEATLYRNNAPVGKVTVPAGRLMTVPFPAGG